METTEVYTSGTSGGAVRNLAGAHCTFTTYVPRVARRPRGRGARAYCTFTTHVPPPSLPTVLPACEFWHNAFVINGDRIYNTDAKMVYD